MTSGSMKEKKLLIQKKLYYILGLIIVFLVVVIFGIKGTWAYYYNDVSISIIANLVGDFDTGDGDVVMMIYKENEEGKFTRTYTIPEVYYKFNDSLTSCSIVCDKDHPENCPYSYSYNASNRVITLTSRERVSCKFYFEKMSATDISISILREDVNGTYDYNSKKYSLVEGVPAYGYVYTNYVCDRPAVLNYNSETKRFIVDSESSNACSVYFDSVGSSDIDTNVYVQTERNGNFYRRVESIPENNIYVLSTTEGYISTCYDGEEVDEDAVIEYENGYIDISASGKRTCDIYLNLQ